MKILLLFIVLILVGCTKEEISLSNQSEAAEPTVNPYILEEINNLKSQLQNANGQMSPETYQEVQNKIKNLEGQGIDTNEIKEILVKFTIGGQNKPGDNNQ